MREDVKKQWDKVKSLYTTELGKIPEVRKAWFQVDYCKHCGAMDETGHLDIVFSKYPLDMRGKMKDVELLIGLQTHPLRIKSEHYGTEKYLIIRDGSELFYFPDKVKEYTELDETILCECSEMDLLWDNDGTYTSQTWLDPDYYTILGKVDSDEAEIKRYAKSVKDTLSEHGWGFENVDGKIHHNTKAYDIVECRFRTWREIEVSETKTEGPKLERTVSLGVSDE